MLQVHFQIGVNLSILIISSPLHPNFKNIQTMWRGTIPLYSSLHYSPPLYSPPSLNFQTGHYFLYPYSTLEGLVPLKNYLYCSQLLIELLDSLIWYQSPSVIMIETWFLASLNEKVSTISRTTYQHEQEIREFHQKFDVVTNVLQTLSETVQSPTRSGNKSQQRPSSLVRPYSPIVISQQESTLTRRLTLTFCHCNSNLVVIATNFLLF